MCVDMKSHIFLNAWKAKERKREGERARERSRAINVLRFLCSQSTMRYRALAKGANSLARYQKAPALKIRLRTSILVRAPKQILGRKHVNPIHAASQSASAQRRPAHRLKFRGPWNLKAMEPKRLTGNTGVFATRLAARRVANTRV